MYFRRFAIVVLAVFWACSICLAQLTTATILGTVTDSSGAVIPGATVVVENMGTSAKVHLVTNAHGIFVAAQLQIGTYKVTASASGFKTFVRQGIQVTSAERMNVPITLEVGAVKQQVTVNGQPSLVQTASAATGGTLTSHAVEDLPINGRAVTDLVDLVPGSVGQSGGGFQSTINGGTDARFWNPGVKYLVDGGDSSQIDSNFGLGGYLSAARLTRVSVDAVAEFKVLTGGQSAEYGQSTGAILDLITKAGTNKFNGDLFEYFGNDKLNARDYFDASPLPKPEFRLNQFGGSLGGPIKKNKLFFFGDYEAVRQRTGLALNSLVFTQNFRNSLPQVLQPVVAMMPLPNGPVSPAEPDLAVYDEAVSNQLTENFFLGKIDYLPSSKDRLTFKFNGDFTQTISYFGVSQGQYRIIPYDQPMVHADWTHTIGPTMVNDAAFDLNRMSAFAYSAATPAVRNFPQVTFALGGAISFGLNGLASVGPSTFNLPVANNAFQYTDTLSWVKGRHQIKFGAHVVRIQENKSLLPQTFVAFATLNDFANNYPFYVMTYGYPRVGMRGTFNAFFAQDDFQVNRKLTLNLGLRYQYDTAPSEAHGRQANFNPATGALYPVGSPIVDSAPKLDFAPRFGFSYSPFASNHTAIRGAFGLYFPDMNPALAQAVPVNLPSISNDFLQIYPGVGFPVPNISQYRASQTLTAIQEYPKSPYTEAWNLNIQQQLGRSMVLQVGYVGNKSLHLINVGQELNPINPATGLRRYANYSSITYYPTCCNANYNALQVSFDRRLSHGLSVGAHYEWSHDFDENTGTYGNPIQNPADPRAEYSTADWDVRNNFVMYYTYMLPSVGKVPEWLGKGWQINGITEMRSGYPVDVLCGCDSAGIGAATARPNLVPGVPLTPSNYNLPNNQFNINAFSVPATGTFGNLGRNFLTGPSEYDWDFSLFKNFRIRENQSLNFRAEIYNIFNTPRFLNPAANLAVPSTFGKSLGSLVPAGYLQANREVQLALKYSF